MPGIRDDLLVSLSTTQFDAFKLTPLRICLVNGLFHFLSVQGYGCKNPGGPLIMIFPEVSISRHIFPGDKFAAWLTFSGGRLKFFSVSFFPEGSNHLGLNSRGFMSQTIILSRVFWFLKI